MEDLQFLKLLATPKPKVKNTPKNQEGKSFHTIFQKLSFPKITDTDIKKITKHVANGDQVGHAIVSNFKEIDFNPTLMNTCKESLQSTQLLFPEEAIFYLIHSIFSWLFFATMAEKQPSISLVLVSTATLKRNVGNAESVSLFSYVLNHTIHLFQNFQITPIIQSMNVFFDKPGPYDSKIFNILFDIFLKKSKFDSETFTNSTLMFLKFFRKLFPHDPSLVTPTVVNTLFTRLDPYLSDFNLDVFRFFRHILPCTKADGIFTFFSTVIKKFEMKIESNEPVFKLHDRSQNSSQEIKVTLPMNPQFVYSLNHSKSLTSSSEILDISIPTLQIDESSKFNNLTKAFIIVSKTKETQMVVEQNFITLIQSKLDSPFLLDYIQAISVILLSFEPSNIISKIVEIILQTGLFDPSRNIFNNQAKLTEKNKNEKTQNNNNNNDETKNTNINGETTNNGQTKNINNNNNNGTTNNDESKNIEEIQNFHDETKNINGNSEDVNCVVSSSGFDDDDIIPIRVNIYYVLLKNFHDCLGLFIDSFLEYPFMITEILMIMGKNTEQIKLNAIEQQLFTSNLQKIAMNYATLMNEKSDSSDVNIYKQLIEYFVIFLSRLFYNKEAAEILFQSDTFISMYFSFTYQPFSRKHILAGFEHSVVNFNVNIPEQAIVHILGILEASKFGETEDDYIIIYDLLVLINSLIKSRSEMIECFVKALEIVCFIMYHLQIYEISEKLLLESINIYKLYDDIQFDSIKCSSFVNGIRILYGKEPSEEVYKQLISLMTQKSTMISQQYVPNLILESFSDSKRSVQYLSFILELCKFSTQNTITIHNGRFDIKLIELVNVKKTSNEELDKEFILQGLKLIEKITATVSSTPVVKQFIGLLCPIKAKYISHYHPDFLNTLQSIIDHKKLNPTNALPLAQSSAFISVNELKPTLLQKGFEMTFWLFTESPEKNVNLLNLSTKEKREITVSIKHRKLILTTNAPNGRSSIYTFDIDVNPYEWFFISLNIIKKTDQINVTGYFNETKLPTIVGQWDAWQFVKCVVGKNTEDTGYQLGSFGIFTTANTESLFSKGPSIIHSNSLFYITCEVINEILTPNCTSSSSITAEFIGPLIIQRVTFTDALVKLCTIECLLPLYAQLDLPYEENVKTPTSMAVVVTSIFSKLLPISHEIQDEFVRSNSISIIQSLLSSLERSDFLTYDLYMEFYVIFTSLTVKKLRSQLFGKILMCFQIWSRSDPKEGVKIARHWEHQLFQEFMPTSVKILSFDKILYFLNKFYPFNVDLDVMAIRQSVIKILLYISTTEYFKHEDIVSLIGHCIIQKRDAKNCSSHICDLISLIQMIAVTPSKPFEKFPDLWKDLTELQQLLNSADEDTIIFTINLFSVLHENQIFNCLTLEQQMNVYLPFFATEFSSSFFNQIVVKASTNSGFFPLTFYIAYINPRVHDTIMSLLKPRNDIVSSVESLFWFFACIYKYNNKFGDFLIRFIYKCKIVPLKTIMVILDVVGAILCQLDQADSTKSRFLLYIGSIIQAGEFEDNFGIFFEVTLQLLLFKKLGYSSLPEKDLSEIYGVVFPQPKKVDFINIVKTKSLVKYLKQIENLEITFVFGVGVKYSEETETFQVSDRSLAQLTINLIVGSNATDFFNEAAILCYFIHDKDKYEFFINSSHVSPEVINCLTAANTNDHIDSNEWYSVISRQFTKINEDYSQFIAKYLQLFCKVFDEIDGNTKKLFTASKSDIGCTTLHQIEVFDDRLELINHVALKNWYHIWDRMTFDRSPWEDARTEQSSQHYKRDMFLCWNMFPCKLKLNINFDDHRLASLMQEVGDMSTAKKILDQEKEIEEKKKMELVESEGTSSSLLQMPNDITNDAALKSLNLSPEEQEKSNNDTVPYESFNAVYYKLEKEKHIKFHVFNNKIVLDFIENENSLTIEASKVSHILMRGILHHPRGLEIFLKNGPSYLIIFSKGNKNVFEILKMISSLRGWSNTLIQTVPHKKFFKQLGIKEKWENGLMSNFEYLLALNSYSGRSFNDPSMYPVFPWIIADYKSQTLDLKKNESFRDLSKPVGALNAERLEKIIKRPNPYDSFVREPYLYPSSYSSLLYVYLFLIRMEPFTSLHIKTQSGKFDHAPRQFISIIKAYDMVNENIQDFRELTPEFFFDHSFLNNTNNFNLGKYEGVQIGDVELPVWAHGNSIEFIYMNRKALESQYVSKNLNKWIDLIWGVNQNGPGAVESNNTFIPYMYESVWSDELINQPGKAEGAEAYLQTCGQIPSQLFFSPHEQKKAPEFPNNYLSNGKEVLNIGIDNICYSCIAESTFNHCKLICVNSKGNVYTVSLSFQENQPLSVSYKQWKGSFHEIEMGMITKVNSSTLAAGTSIGKVELVNAKTSEPLIFSRHLGKITCVNADELYLVTGGSDTATNIFISNYSSSNSSSSIQNNASNPNLTLTKSSSLYGNFSEFNFSFFHFFPSFRDDVSCCAVNSHFDLVVSGTLDCSLFFFSPTHKDVMRIIDLHNKIPEKVLITDGWGFVVVYELNLEKGNEFQCIEVYNVNGDLIISKPLQFQLQQWTTWKSVDGFDYLLMMSKGGIVFTCEVFYLDIIKAIKDRVELKVLSMSYSYELGIIFVGLNDGSIQMLPFR
ncbi:hypothetical protein M9Y10_022824 [Tritrichomonas musculus]|uniref:BEACH domain-containing protein n=1 Tax=Tritrichomonas musculus TaxID=1915356 RepID=A0ABR2KTF7_9EUKA